MLRKAEVGVVQNGCNFLDRINANIAEILGVNGGKWSWRSGVEAFNIKNMSFNFNGMRLAMLVDAVEGV